MRDILQSCKLDSCVWLGIIPDTKPINFHTATNTITTLQIESYTITRHLLQPIFFLIFVKFCILEKRFPKQIRIW